MHLKQQAITTSYPLSNEISSESQLPVRSKDSQALSFRHSKALSGGEFSISTPLFFVRCAVYGPGSPRLREESSPSHAFRAEAGTSAEGRSSTDSTRPVPGPKGSSARLRDRRGFCGSARHASAHDSRALRLRATALLDPSCPVCFEAFSAPGTTSVSEA
jgi:hypothetical protein